MSDRPIDALDRAKGKKIYIKLKNGEEVTGILKALDLHLNLWVDEAEISNKTEGKVKMGTILVRGDTIVYASPVQV
ncbi:MAG: small nuclear ribonucleoprotein [Candidatus Aenigmarchaeota archaeon]|jgi:small nuclear ribonucleoprotein|nr:small nuclear ribonucleoprotein [Candidatus Aenigmarchaeota archaeon]